jgi:hypothetical protein
MRTEETIDIAATPEAIWTVLMDVEHWHEWTESITSLSYLEGPPLRHGSRVRARQPRLPAAVWTVTSLEPNQQFTWESSSMGINLVATHRLDTLEAGRTRVTLSVDQSGPLAWLGNLIFGRLGRRYVRMEAEGLKRRAERPDQA